MPAFQLYSLGGLRLHGPESELLRGRRKDLVLLVYLARRAPRAASRQELAALLWGEQKGPSGEIDQPGGRGEQRADPHRKT